MIDKAALQFAALPAGNKEDQEYFACLAHDLKSPLSFVLSGSKVLGNEAKELEPTDVDYCLQIVIKNVERLAERTVELHFQ